MEKLQVAHIRHIPVTLKALIFRIYILKLILVKEFLNVANEKKITILGGKRFQTFTTRSLKDFPRVGATVVHRQLEGLPRLTVRSLTHATLHYAYR